MAFIRCGAGTPEPTYAAVYSAGGNTITPPTGVNVSDCTPLTYFSYRSDGGLQRHGDAEGHYTVDTANNRFQFDTSTGSTWMLFVTLAIDS